MKAATQKKYSAQGCGLHRHGTSRRFGRAFKFYPASHQGRSISPTCVPVLRLSGAPPVRHTSGTTCFSRQASKCKCRERELNCRRELNCHLVGRPRRLHSPRSTTARSMSRGVRLLTQILGMIHWARTTVFRCSILPAGFPRPCLRPACPTGHQAMYLDRSALPTRGLSRPPTLCLQVCLCDADPPTSKSVGGISSSFRQATKEAMLEAAVKGNSEGLA